MLSPTAPAIFHKIHHHLAVRPYLGHPYVPGPATPDSLVAEMIPSFAKMPDSLHGILENSVIIRLSNILEIVTNQTLDHILQNHLTFYIYEILWAAEAMYNGTNRKQLLHHQAALLRLDLDATVYEFDYQGTRRSLINHLYNRYRGNLKYPYEPLLQFDVAFGKEKVLALEQVWVQIPREDIYAWRTAPVPRRLPPYRSDATMTPPVPVGYNLQTSSPRHAPSPRRVSWSDDNEEEDHSHSYGGFLYAN